MNSRIHIRSPLVFHDFLICSLRSCLLCMVHFFWLIVVCIGIKVASAGWPFTRYTHVFLRSQVSSIYHFDCKFRSKNTLTAEQSGLTRVIYIYFISI